MVAEDVRDSGYRGRADADIFEYALEAGLALVTSDVGFGSAVWLTQREHLGVIIVRFPNEMSTPAINEAVVRTVAGLSDDTLAGNVVIVEPGRFRLRRTR